MAIQTIQVLSTTDRPKGQKLVVELQDVSGQVRVDVRNWYPHSENEGEHLPGKGISLTVAEFEALAKVKLPKVDASKAGFAPKAAGRKL